MGDEEHPPPSAFSIFYLPSSIFPPAFPEASSAPQCATTSFSAPSTNRVCGKKSSSTSGDEYSYGPWYTTGVARKFPCGGGVGAATHSSVVACQGFCGAFLPHIHDPMKLMMNGICPSPS